MKKKIPNGLNILTRKNKKCHVYFPIPYIQPSLPKDHQTVTMNHYCYCLMSPEK